MPDIESLVTWHEPTSLGDFPGEGRAILFGDNRPVPGRPSRLEAVQYPEGYIAIRAVDILTGEALGDPTYSDSASAPERGSDQESRYPIPKIRRLYPAVDIGDDRQITALRYHNDYTIQTDVTPAQSRLFTRAFITPHKKTLFVEGKGGAGDNRRAFGHLQIQQGNVGPEMRGCIVVGIGSGKRRMETSRVCADLDTQGQLSSERPIRAQRRVLQKLGLKRLASRLTYPEGADWTEISDKTQQIDVMDAVAKLLGMDKWRGLDLRLSAAGLYAALGKSNLNIADVIVPARTDREHGLGL
jgi:hypothetical protein